MRIASSLLLFVILAAGALAVAQAEDTDPKMKGRIEALELQVRYLRSRETALTRYILQNEQRARGLATIADKTRKAGFTQAAIPFTSRDILLKGMEQLAAHLRKDLPLLTKKDHEMMRAITRAAQAGH